MGRGHNNRPTDEKMYRTRSNTIIIIVIIETFVKRLLQLKNEHAQASPSSTYGAVK